MANISSISFQEDFVLWTEASVENEAIHLERAVSDSLPISINHSTINDPSTAKEIGIKLKNLSNEEGLNTKQVRLNFPGRFAIIKKVMVDKNIDPQHYPEIVAFNLSQAWKEPKENYSLFIPEFSRSAGTYREVMAVAILNRITDFFSAIAEEAGLNVENVSPSCFTVDNFFRQMDFDYNNHVLLLGLQRRGYDVIISDKQDIVRYSFRPYDADLKPIDQIEEDEFISHFDNLLDEIKQPTALSKPLYDIHSIYFYGFHFKPVWLDMIQAQIQIPVSLFNLNQSAAYNVTIHDPDIDATKLYQFIEPLSNII